MAECANCKILQKQIDQLTAQWRTILKPTNYDAPKPTKYPMHDFNCTCGNTFGYPWCPVHDKKP